MNTITFQPLRAIGAEVVGLTKASVLEDEQLPGAVMDALEDNGVLVFRGLHFDDDTQVAFCRRLGDIVEATRDGKLGIQIISLDPERAASAAYLRGTFDWHVDGATQNLPPNRATILTAHQVADEGGDTEFASTYAAYDEQRDEWSTLPRCVHPLVWTHRSGRRSLLLGATALCIEGMEYVQGRQFLQELLDRATTPNHVYQHKWAVGDTLVWDNCGVLHRALPYDVKSPRDMHRTTLVGDELIK